MEGSFVQIATVVAWPLVTLLVFGAFYRPASKLLLRLAESLTFKSMKVRALGIEVELTPEAARSILHELLHDITESTNELSAEEIALFDEIHRASGRKTVGDIFPGFVRGDKEGRHERLRNLRDQKLIIPKDGGPWKPEKVPIVTRYGLLVCKLRTNRSSIVTAFNKESVG